MLNSHSLQQGLNMTTETQVRAPLTEEQIIDLRRRVLAGEEVSPDELRHALDQLALRRVTASQGAVAKAAKATGVSLPKIDLQSAFAAFRQKQQTGGSAPSGTEGNG